MPFSSPPKPDRCKAIFLDRDGVINHDPGDYTRSIEEFSILPTALEALRILAEKGYIFILITNQGGIAKGIYSHDAVNEIHNHLRKLCNENGTPLTDVYYSPHHEITGLSLSRKPGSMMVERAIARYNINPAESWMIGDKQRDLDCASVLGVQGVLIPTNGALIDYIHSLA
jgi:D-glycero-D-manno-heptose 1,7-bisphosphate phosphatase